MSIAVSSQTDIRSEVQDKLDDLSEIKYLVFEGGGIKGTAFAEIPKVLESFGILKNIVGVAGTSAGSIIALLIALKYNPQSIKELTSKMRFDKFRDNSLCTVMTISLLFSGGIHTGNKFVEWIKKIIQYKLGNPNATFQNLYDKTGIELVVTGTALNGQKTVFFSKRTHGFMELWKAIRISISIPLYFTPVYYQGDIFVDGGILNNYPIWIFDNPDSYEFNYKSVKGNHNETLGFKLTSKEGKNPSTLNIPVFVPPVVRLLYALFETTVHYIDEQYKQTGYWERTVGIDTFDTRSTDFNINEERINKLILSGEQATANAVKNRIIAANLSRRMSNPNLSLDLQSVREQYTEEHYATGQQKPSTMSKVDLRTSIILSGEIIQEAKDSPR